MEMVLLGTRAAKAQPQKTTMKSLDNNCPDGSGRFGALLLKRSIVLSFAVALQALLVQRLRGENHFDYRYDDYQEDDDSIHVRTHSAFLEFLINSSVSLNAEFVYDAISGATPTGGPPPAGSNQVPLAHMEDERWAGNISSPIRWGGNQTTTPQFAYSLESDLSLIHI